MENTKLIIFDFDGTLADTIPHIVNCIIKCISKFNLKPLTKEDVQKYSGSVLQDSLKHLGATDEMLPEIKKYYADIFLEDMSDIHLYDGVKETLLKLKENGYILAVASNRGRNTIVPLLDYLGISDLFTKIICESDVEKKKPNPQMVEYLLRETNCEKNETLIIGDTAFDILMGKNANCHTCLISYKDEVNDDVLRLEPDNIIYSFNELENIVTKMI